MPWKRTEFHETTKSIFFSMADCVGLLHCHFWTAQGVL